MQSKRHVSVQQFSSHDSFWVCGVKKIENKSNSLPLYTTPDCAQLPPLQAQLPTWRLLCHASFNGCTRWTTLFHKMPVFGRNLEGWCPAAEWIIENVVCDGGVHCHICRCFCYVCTYMICMSVYNCVYRCGKSNATAQGAEARKGILTSIIDETTKTSSVLLFCAVRVWTAPSRVCVRVQHRGSLGFVFFFMCSVYQSLRYSGSCRKPVLAPPL